jgi:hypothetical protein
MTNLEIATLTASIVADFAENSTTDNIHKLTAAYREIYATIKEVDQEDCKERRKIIEKQLAFLVQTNELIFSGIMNSPIHGPLNNILFDALNKNIQTILSIVS